MCWTRCRSRGRRGEGAARTDQDGACREAGVRYFSSLKDDIFIEGYHPDINDQIRVVARDARPMPEGLSSLSRLSLEEKKPSALTIRNKIESVHLGDDYIVGLALR